MVADELLVATGRRPMFEPHDLAAAGIELDDEGNAVLTETLRTRNPDVWVAGDATGDLLFTHVGSYEAELVVKDILGHPEARDYRVVPTGDVLRSRGRERRPHGAAGSRRRPRRDHLGRPVRATTSAHTSTGARTGW